MRASKRREEKRREEKRREEKRREEKRREEKRREEKRREEKRREEKRRDKTLEFQACPRDFMNHPDVSFICKHEADSQTHISDSTRLISPPGSLMFLQYNTINHSKLQSELHSITLNKWW